MPFIKVYIHFVWSTKYRIPYLDTLELRQKVWQHIKENAVAKGIHVDYVNGHKEHCHCLVSMNSDQTIQQIMHLIKGESSYWINLERLTETRFEWQNDYFAVSVSESQVARVRNYIKNQENHHKNKSFEEEYEEWITKFGFEKFQDS